MNTLRLMNDRRALFVLLLALPASTPAADPLADAVASDLQVAELTAAQQETLDDAVAKFREPGTGRLLDPGALDVVLDRVDQARPDSVAFWEKASRWLARQLSRLGIEIDVGPGESWLVPPWVVDLLAIVLVVGVLALVVNELRHGRWSRQRRPGGAGAADEPHPNHFASLDDLDALPPRERPGAALKFVLAELAAKGLGLFGRARTHREIAVDSGRIGPEPGSLLAALARLAERARYAGRSTPEEVATDALDTSRAILRHFEDVKDP